MKKSTLVIIALTAIIAGSCKKYEEGALVSTLCIKKRIYGFHTLTGYYVNEVDSLSQYYDSLGLSFDFIYDEDAYIDACIMDGPRRDGFSGDLYWWWELNDNKASIIIKASGGTAYGVGPFGIHKTPTWQIIKMEKKQIKLKTSFNNKEYIIVLDR